LIQVRAQISPRWLNAALMKLFRLAFIASLAAPLPALAVLPLQPWLDTALPGASVRLPPGTYAGPAVISRPLTLDGDGKEMTAGPA